MPLTHLTAGRGWLDTDAAASIYRIDTEIGHPLQITEAGRTWSQQDRHYQRYLKHGSPIALSPDAPSVHQEGEAIDSNEAQRLLDVMHRHGWRRTVYRNSKLVEPWHFEYFIKFDQYRNSGGNAAGSEDDMTPEERTMLKETHSMLLEVRDYLGARGGHNTKTPDTMGHKVNEIRDYLGAGGGKGTKSSDTVGHWVKALFEAREE